jgi:Raf kinase inhibitor-like YbhB/YbcL family protein
MKPGLIILFDILLLAHIGEANHAQGEGNMRISSPDFRNNGMMPGKFTCDGENVNPCLVIEGIPQAARSLALVVDDPDAPMGTWVHWVVYDMPLLSRIEQDAVQGRQGTNDFGKGNYGGPCPPSGTHRYFFKLYALDTVLGLKEGLSKKELERSMQGHILEKAELVGLYKRAK